jgi:hypothetical protein
MISQQGNSKKFEKFASRVLKTKNNSHIFTFFTNKFMQRINFKIT